MLLVIKPALKAISSFFNKDLSTYVLILKILPKGGTSPGTQFVTLRTSSFVAKLKLFLFIINLNLLKSIFSFPGRTQRKNWPFDLNIIAFAPCSSLVPRTLAASFEVGVGSCSNIL